MANLCNIVLFTSWAICSIVKCILNYLMYLIFIPIIIPPGYCKQYQDMKIERLKTSWHACFRQIGAQITFTFIHYIIDVMMILSLSYLKRGEQLRVARAVEESYLVIHHVLR